MVKTAAGFSFITAILLISCSQKPMLEKITNGLNFPEGPAWDGIENVYISNCKADWIGRLNEGKIDTFVTKTTIPYNFGKTNGLVFNQDGFLYACDYENGAIIRFSKDGRCELVTDGYEDQRFNRPNDLAFGNNGDLYFTDPHAYDPENRDGIVYVYSFKTGSVHPVYEGLGFPNGIAFSADGRSLFVSESALNRVLKFPVEEDGNLREYTVFAEIPGGDPDGLALDQAGNIYVAHFGGGKVYKLDPDGSVADIINIPGKKPSNVEFGDDDLRTLYITEVETNAIYRIRVGIPGLRLFSLP
jgi:gluconolactonase